MRSGTWICAVLILSNAPELLACAVCTDRSASTSSDALNLAIFVLLGVLGVVFGGLAFFITRLALGAKREVPEHVQLAESIQN